MTATATIGRSIARRLVVTRAAATPGKWAIFGLVSVGTFMTTLDASIVNIALPSIAHAFGTPVSGSVEWVVIGYLVVIAATLLSFARLADIAGRERVWIGGLALFTVGSALSGLAPTLVLLVAARGLQGVGAALIFAPALALIVDAFPRSQRGQALGMNALIVSLGVTAGPTLGGLITESLGWRWIFFVNVPLGLIGLLVARRVFTFERGARARRFDLGGAIAFGLGLASLSLGLSFGSEWGWTSPGLILTLGVSFLALGSAILIERRRRDPLVDLGQLLSRRLGLPLAAFLFSILALFAVSFLLPFYLEELRGLTPLAAGLLLTPYSLGLAVAAPIAGRLADRGHARWLGPVGLGLAAAGLGFLAQIGTTTSQLEIVLWLAMSGIGQGLFLSPNTTAIMSAVPADQSGTASGLIATTRVVGQALSVAIGGAIFIGLGGAAAGATLVAGGAATPAAKATLDGTFVAAMHTALLVSGLLAAAGALTSLHKEPGTAIADPEPGGRPVDHAIQPSYQENAVTAIATDPKETPLAATASSDADYVRLGLARKDIKVWEDGARTDDRPGSYEWWYFDAHLEDGAKLVVVFMDKDLATPQKPLEPTIRLNLDLADGRSFERFVTFDPGLWSSATDHADVRIGENRFTGDLHTYRITATVDDIAVDITLESEVPAWRPETGYMLFGEDRKLEFAWLPAVPHGRVIATYSIGGERHQTTGAGYHDHNWGNVGMMEIIHDWYWARGQAGPYSVIASYITAHEKYGYTGIPVFMLAKDGALIGDDPSRLTFETLGTYIDSVTRKPVANITRYTYRTGDERYVVTFTRHRDLSRNRMIEGLHGVRRAAAELLRFDGAYLRFSGEIRVEHFRGTEIVDQSATDDAIWELMYFGHARV